MLSQLSYSPISSSLPRARGTRKSVVGLPGALPARVVSSPTSCRSGEIGIRRALKRPRSQGHVGSSPTSGTSGARTSVEAVDAGFAREVIVPDSRPAHLATARHGKGPVGAGGSARGLRAVWGLVIPLLLAGPVAAQEREFSGKIQELGAGELLLHNRRGDEIRFQRVPETRVSGGDGAKGNWGQLRVGDRATVRWKLADSPPVAYQVIVLPRGRDGEG